MPLKVHVSLHSQQSFGFGGGQSWWKVPFADCCDWRFELRIRSKSWYWMLGSFSLTFAIDFREKSLVIVDMKEILEYLVSQGADLNKENDSRWPRLGEYAMGDHVSNLALATNLFEFAPLGCIPQQVIRWADALEYSCKEWAAGAPRDTFVAFLLIQPWMIHSTQRLKVADLLKSKGAR